jgi:hypothetical protein
MEIRMAHLEGAYEQISDCLNGIDLRLAAIEVRIDSTRDMLLSRIDSLQAGMDRKFIWLTGLVLVSILLPLVQRLVPHG